MKLRIGSRGSQLALWQANHIAGLLRGAGHDVEIEIIKTTGDRLQEVTFAQVGAISGTSKGMFTKEIEEALAEGRIDLAVHSLKDLPTELPEPFTLAATPVRVDPRDVFVSVKHANLAALPEGARVGTSSQRRRAQLKALRPDLDLVEFRGNVDTRLRKLAEGQVEAILLAAAGLDRLGRTDWVRERLSPSEFCPAAGQGALGIEARKNDAATIDAVSFLDHADTRFAVAVERSALAALGGGCQVPIGIYCRPKLYEAGEGTNESTSESGPRDEVFAIVADPASGKAVRVHHQAFRETSEPEALGRLIARMLIESGAGPLLEVAGESAGGGCVVTALPLAGRRVLEGRRILVTRAAHQAGKLSEGLRALGAEPVEVPVLEIQPPGNYEALDDAVTHLDRFDWLILTSTNTIQAIGARCAQFAVNPGQAEGLKIAAIGSATAEMARHYGYDVNSVPKEYLAESLVAELAPQIAGKRVLLARAEIARDVIPDALRTAGATVDVVDAYRNVMPSAAPELLRKALAKGIDAVTFTSSSSVTHLADAAHAAGLPFPFAGIQAVSIGPITSQTLRDHGWEPAAEASVSDVPGLIAATADSLTR